MKNYNPELKPAWKTLNLSLLLHFIYLVVNIAILCVEWHIFSSIYKEAYVSTIITTYVIVPLISAIMLFILHLVLFFMMRKFIICESFHLGAVGIVGVIYSICSISVIPQMTSIITKIYSQSTITLLQRQLMSDGIENSMEVLQKYMVTNSTLTGISSITWYIFVAASVFFMLACSFCWSYNQLRNFSFHTTQKAVEITDEETDRTENLEIHEGELENQYKNDNI